METLSALTDQDIGVTVTPLMRSIKTLRFDSPSSYIGYIEYCENSGFLDPNKSSATFNTRKQFVELMSQEVTAKFNGDRELDEESQSKVYDFMVSQSNQLSERTVLSQLLELAEDKNAVPTGRLKQFFYSTFKQYPTTWFESDRYLIQTVIDDAARLKRGSKNYCSIVVSKKIGDIIKYAPGFTVLFQSENIQTNLSYILGYIHGITVIVSRNIDGSTILYTCSGDDNEVGDVVLCTYDRKIKVDPPVGLRLTSRFSVVKLGDAPTKKVAVRRVGFNRPLWKYFLGI